MTLSTGNTDIDYKAIYEQVVHENEQLRLTLIKMHQLSMPVEQAKQWTHSTVEIIKKNPFLAIWVATAVYVTLTILEFLIRRMHHER